MKKIFLLLPLILAFSCSKNENKLADKITEDNVKVAKELFMHFNNHDWQKMANLYTDIAEFKEPESGMLPHKKTKSEIVKEYAEMQKQFPDVQDSVVAIYPSGKNKVIVEFVASASLPDKTKFQLPICTIFTIENGRITKDYSYFDNSK